MNAPNPATPDTGAEWTWKETLADGTPVVIRPLRESDHQSERAFIEGLSAKTMHNRFLGQIPHPTDDFIRRLIHVDMINDVALAAVMGEGSNSGSSASAATPRIPGAGHASARSWSRTRGSTRGWERY